MTRPAHKPGLISLLAPVAANAFYEISGLPERWETIPEYKRATFRRVASEAVSIAKVSNRLGVDARTQVAVAVAGAFLDPRDCPAWLIRRYGWSQGTEREASRPIWLFMADAIIAEGRRLRAQQDQRRAA
ncbi:MAG: hypothetical protein U1C74_02175 [Phenylobacterium sp.]|nr:hypothetical protein [Phenylobacterium sp.]